jgi:hypothetical protein
MQWKTGLLGTVSLLTTATITKAGPLDEWSWLNPKPQGNSLAGVTYADNRFVAVGSGGSIVTSDDGQNWVNRSFTNLSMSAVTYGAGKFLAVGRNQQIMTSTNGIDWISKNFAPQVFTDLKGICHGQNGFVAVGGIGSAVIATSLDGVVWKQRVPSGPPSSLLPLNAVAYGNGVYIAVGGPAVGGENILAVSINSTNWTDVSSGVSNTTLAGVAFGKGLFVVAGVRASLPPVHHVILTSANGTDWQSFQGTTNTVHSVFFDGSRFVLTGDGIVFLSDDGLSWSPHAVPGAQPLRAATAGNGQLVGVGDFSTIVTSPDGTNWSNLVPGNADLYRGICAGRSRTVVVGNSGITTSTDNLTWHLLESVTNQFLNAVTTNGAQFIVVGNGGTILTSADGDAWDVQTSSTTNSLNAIACADGLLITVGNAGQILISTNGIDWSPQNSGITQNLQAIARANGLFIAVGNNGTAVTSSNAQSWSSLTPFTSARLTSVAYGRGSFAVSDSEGFIWTSTDGRNWTNRVAGSGATGLTHARGIFLAVGVGGMIRSSVDGINWPIRRSATANSLWAAAPIEGNMIVVGEGGTILQSQRLLRMVSPRRSSGTTLFGVVGEAGTACRLETSADLSNWQDLGVFTNTGAAVGFSDTNAAPVGFYRVVQE